MSVHYEILDKNFYRTFFTDLAQFSDENLQNHYDTHGKKENRFCCLADLKNFMETNFFDFAFYRNFYEDLHPYSTHEVFYHFIDYGRKEGRFGSVKKLQEFVEDPEFDYIFYKEYYTDLASLSNFEASQHYKCTGKSEGRFSNKNKFREFVGDKNFDVDFYKENNLDLQHLNKDQLILHYKQCGHGEIRNFSPRFVSNNNLFFSASFDICHHDYIFYSTDKNYFPHSQIEHHNNNEVTQYLPLRNLKHTYQNIKPQFYHLSSLDNLTNFVLVLDFNNHGGGTNFFINSVISKYKMKQTFLILRPFNDTLIQIFVNDDYQHNSMSIKDMIHFLRNKEQNIEKIFINHTYYFTYEMLEFVLVQLKKEKVFVTHDFNMVNTLIQPLYHQIQNVQFFNHQFPNINSFDTIIIQNIELYHVYKKFIQPNKKIIVSPLPDFHKRDNIIFTNNQKLVLGVIGHMQPIKGEMVIHQIIEYIKLKNLNIEVIVFGYLRNYSKCFYYKDIHELNNLLIKHKPNALLETSIWMETYSYTLTLSKLIGLPIFSLRKPFDSVIENRLSDYENAFEFSNAAELVTKIQKFSQHFFYTISPRVYFNSFWENLFITKKTIIPQPFRGNYAYNLKPYPIYFPQFHAFTENNLSFYDGFNDVKNLKYLIDNDYHDIVDFETPSCKTLELNKIEDYILTDASILQKQIDIITHYNFEGFAMYYFWFSINTITGKKTIMTDVINKFFDGSVQLKGRKIFFIWANEAWSKNPAFNVTNNKIETDYSQSNMQIFANDLIPYFKHANYLKINNKPVFSLHQSWLLNEIQLQQLYEILFKTCIDNGFDGVHTFKHQPYHDQPENSFINNYHHFNYKSSKTSVFDPAENIRKINYKTYLENDLCKDEKKGIHTLVFDFDNRARMVKPDRLNCCTVVENNTEFEKVKMIKEIKKKYEREKSEVENILLINAWNEWGEKMTLEPSNEYEFYYLNLFFEHMR
jgi:hypothetical protein